MESNRAVIGLRVFFETLLVVLITLKMAGSIDWSWAWVIAPLWIPCVAACVLALVSVLRVKR